MIDSSFQATLLLSPSPLVAEVDLVSDQSCNACKISAVPLSFWGKCHGAANARRATKFHRRLFVVCARLAHTIILFAKNWDESRPKNLFVFFTHLLSLFRSPFSSLFSVHPSPLSFQATLLLSPSPLVAEVDLVSDQSCNA